MRKVWISLGISVVVLGAGVTALLFWTPGSGILHEAGRSSRGEISGKESPPGDARSEPAPAPTSVPASEAGPGESSAEQVLHGKVSGPDGAGIQAATVMVIAADVPEDVKRDDDDRDRLDRERFLGKVGELCCRRVVARALTDEAGLYSISLAAIAPGAYLVLARHPGHLPEQKNWTRKAETTELHFQLALGELITGTVLEREGTPIQDAVVEALQEEPGWWGIEGAHGLVDLATTGNDGRFQLAVPPGAFIIAVEAQGFLREDVRSVDSGTEDLVIILRPAPGLSVKVLAERRPVEGARLSLFALPRDGWWQDQPERAVKLLQSPQARGETDGRGVCVFVGVPSEHYYLSVEKPGLVTNWTQGDLNEEGGTASIEIDMRPAAVLGAVVKDPDGNPVSGAFIAIGKDPSSKKEQGEGEAPPPEPLSPWHAEAGGETDADGRFTFDTLPRGLYSLSVQKDDFVPARRDGFLLEDRAELEITLGRGIRLEGAVLSRTGRVAVPDVGIEIRVNDVDLRQVKTGPDGRYAIAGLSPGRIKDVRLDARGYAFTSIKDLRIGAFPAVQHHDFTLDPAAAIGGTVIDPNGAAVSGALVRVRAYSGGAPTERRSPGTRSVQTSTDSAGKFAIGEVTALSPVEIIIEHPAFRRFTSDPLTLEPGSRRENLRFQLSSGARVVAWVKDPDGMPVPGAQVRIEPRFPAQGPAGDDDSSSQPRRRRVMRPSGPDGKALFAGIDGGEFLLTCTAAGFQPHAARVDAVDGQELTVAVDLLPEMSITGLVTDTSGMPVAGAYVGVGREREGLPAEWRSDRSRADGTFRLGSLGSGGYYLVVSCEDFVESRLPEVEAGTSVTVPLARLGRIAGQVLAAGSGMPVTRFQLRVVPQGAPGEPAHSGRQRPAARSKTEWRTFEDSAGAFQLGKIGPGAYIVKAAAAEIGVGEERVTLEEGQTLEGLVILLDDGLSILGMAVRQETSEPIAGAEVYLVGIPPRVDDGEQMAPADGKSRPRRIGDDGEREPLPRSGGDREQQESEIARKLYLLALENQTPVLTNESGAFQLPSVAPGSYEVVIYHEAFVPFRQHLDVRLDGAAPEVLARLDPGETLRGEIRLADGSAAAGVMVRIRDVDGIQKRAFTNAAGRYIFSGLLPGTYNLTVEQGQEALLGAQTLAIESNRENRFDWKLAPVEPRG